MDTDTKIVARVISNAASFNLRRLRIRSPQPRHGIRIERFVRADDRHVFDHRLHDQQAVERIVVVEWKCRQPCDVLDSDAEERDIVVALLLRDDCRERVAKCKFPDTDLDGDLPGARDAETNIVPAILDEPACGHAQLRISIAEPEERMRVEQEAHLFHILAEIFERRVEVVRHIKDESFGTPGSARSSCAPWDGD